MALILIIKVVPSSGTQSWKLDRSGQIKCFLKNQPEKGKANKELQQFLAESLEVPLAVIELLTGQTSRLKRVRINLDLTYEHVLQKLGLPQVDVPMKIF